MGVVVDLGQVLKVKMGIYLRGGDISVPQQFLYGAEITAGFQYVTGARMSQHMRVKPARQAAFATPLLQA